MSNRRLRIIVLALISLFVLFLVWGFINSSAHKNELRINIQAVPHDSKITLNGKLIHEGTIYLNKGSNTFTVSRQYFTTVTRVYKTQDLTKDQAIYLLPDAISAEAINYLSNNPKIQQERESAGGADQSGQNIRAKLPIIKELPFIDQLYRVDYGSSKKYPNDPNAVALYVTYYTQDAKQQAIDWLKFKGINTDTQEIIFKDANAQTGN